MASASYHLLRMRREVNLFPDSISMQWESVAEHALSDPALSDPLVAARSLRPPPAINASAPAASV